MLNTLVEVAEGMNDDVADASKRTDGSVDFTVESLGLKDGSNVGLCDGHNDWVG